MTGIVLNNAEIQESVKSNHVTYVERYQSGTGGGGQDAEGNPIPTFPIYSEATHYSNAKITGKVVASNANVFSNGIRVAVQGDATQENWVADPAPSPKMGGTIISISPGTSGSGQGVVGQGSANVFSNGKRIATKGTPVRTHLNTETTISEGTPNVNVGS